jgi:hypothetical protein
LSIVAGTKATNDKLPSYTRNFAIVPLLDQRLSSCTKRNAMIFVQTIGGRALAAGG